MARTPEAPDATKPAPGTVNLGFAEVLGALPKVMGRTWRGLVVADVLFKAFAALLSLAYTSVMLSHVMGETGRAAVTNTDIAEVLLRPSGLFLAFLGGAGLLFLIFVEQAALMAVAAVLFYRPQTTAWAIAKAGAAAAQRIARLAGLLVLIALAIVIPALGASALLYKLVLGAHDINFYLSTKPPAFLAVAGVAGALLLAAAATLATFYVRSLLALPILLFEGRSPVAGIRESFARTGGAGGRIAALLVVWHGAWLIAGWLLLEGFRALAGLGFDVAESTFGAVVAAALAVVGLALLGAALSFGAWAGHSLLVMRIFTKLDPEWRRDEPAPEPPGTGGGDAPLARRAALAALLLLLAVSGVSITLVRGLARMKHTEISAHRGYSKIAPENTLAAVRKAVEAGADWVEIDVQETADGVVVVTHDRDLMRMAGDPRRVTEVTFEELRALDVGTPFAPEYAGERVPSLEEVLAYAHGKVKLNVELKYYGEDPRLARDVARLLEKWGFAGDSLVASLNFPVLDEVKAENPALRTGAIVTVKVGDITRLDAEVLSVSAGLVDFWLMRGARRAGKEVLVWTVDDPRVARMLMGRGVHNLITNDPALLVKVRDDWEKRSKAEKLLLAARYILGLGEGGQEIPSQGEM